MVTNGYTDFTPNRAFTARSVGVVDLESLLISKSQKVLCSAPHHRYIDPVQHLPVDPATPPRAADAPQGPIGVR